MILLVDVRLSFVLPVGVEGDEEVVDVGVVELEEGALQERLRGEVRMRRRSAVRRAKRAEGTALRFDPADSPNSTCHIDRRSARLETAFGVCRSGT